MSSIVGSGGCSQTSNSSAPRAMTIREVLQNIEKTLVMAEEALAATEAGIVGPKPKDEPNTEAASGCVDDDLRAVNRRAVRIASLAKAIKERIG